MTAAAILQHVAASISGTPPAAGAPAPPSGLIANPVSETQINLAWTENATNETSYEIERSDSGAGGPFSKIADEPPNTDSYQDKGLATATQFWYRVRAKNAAGASDWSNVASATTQTAGTPDAPQDLLALAVAQGRIDLIWDNQADNATNNEIEVATAGAGGPFSALATVAAADSDFTHAGLGNESQRWYRVRATNATGNSEWSNVSTATTFPAQALTVIDQAWIDDVANGGGSGGPWYCKGNNVHWRLDVAVVADRTAFAISGTNITFEQTAGANITFSNLANPAFPDGNFAANWNFSGAIQQHSPASFINSEVWPLSADGGTSCKITVPASDQEIDCATTVNLTNTEFYKIKAHFHLIEGKATAGAQLYVRLEEVGNPANAFEISSTGPTSRQMQLVAGNVTQPVTGTYKFFVGCRGCAGEPASVYFVSHVQIVRRNEQGIALLAQNTNSPKLDQTKIGVANDLTVLLGANITQANPVYSSDGIFTGSANSQFHVVGQFQTPATATITVIGAMSHCMSGSGSTASSRTVHDVRYVTGSAAIDSIESRDNQQGYAFSETVPVNTVGCWRDVVVTACVQGAVKSGGPLVIDRCVMSGDLAAFPDLYTNNHAFRTNPTGQQDVTGAGKIRHVTMVITGGSRGLNAKYDLDITDNMIDVKSDQQNQEYAGAPLGGGKCFQTEKWNGGKVQRNQLFMRGSVGGACLQFGGSSGGNVGGVIDCSGNECNALPVADYGVDADRFTSCYQAGEIDPAYIDIHDNTYNTSTNWFRIGSSAPAIIPPHVDCVFKYDDQSFPLAKPYAFGANSSMDLIRPVYFNAAAKTFARNPIADLNNPNNTRAGASVFHKFGPFTVTFTDGASPLTNAALVVTDQDMVEIFNGTTDGSGNVAFALLVAFRCKGSVVDFVYTATSGGLSGTFTVDENTAAAFSVALT